MGAGIGMPNGVPNGMIGRLLLIAYLIQAGLLC